MDFLTFGMFSSLCHVFKKLIVRLGFSPEPQIRAKLTCVSPCCIIWMFSICYSVSALTTKALFLWMCLWLQWLCLHQYSCTKWFLLSGPSEVRQGGWAHGPFGNPTLGVNYISSIRCSGSQVDDGGGLGWGSPTEPECSGALNSAHFSSREQRTLENKLVYLRCTLEPPDDAQSCQIGHFWPHLGHILFLQIFYMQIKLFWGCCFFCVCVWSSNLMIHQPVCHRVTWI